MQGRVLGFWGRKEVGLLFSAYKKAPICGAFFKYGGELAVRNIVI